MKYSTSVLVVCCTIPHTHTHEHYIVLKTTLHTTLHTHYTSLYYKHIHHTHTWIDTTLLIQYKHTYFITSCTHTHTHALHIQNIHTTNPSTSLHITHTNLCIHDTTQHYILYAVYTRIHTDTQTYTYYMHGCIVCMHKHTHTNAHTHAQ